MSLKTREWFEWFVALSAVNLFCYDALDITHGGIDLFVSLSTAFIYYRYIQLRKIEKLMKRKH